MDKNSQEYKKAKRIADSKYNKPSAYKSGYISRLYKQFGGKFDDSKKKRGLNTWFDKEKWIDIEQYVIHNKIKPCGYSKIPLCRPLHGKYGIKYYDIDKIKKSLDKLKQKKSKQQTINWNIYKK